VQNNGQERTTATRKLIHIIFCTSLTGLQSKIKKKKVETEMNKWQGGWQKGGLMG